MTIIKANCKPIFIMSVLLIVLTACGLSNTDTSPETNVGLDNLEVNSSADIVLSKTSISSGKSAVDISGTSVTITGGGEYSVSGILEDGQIIIDAPGEDVNIVLDNVAITNSSGPAIYVIEAKKVVITLAANSLNTLTDGDKYDDLNLDEDAPNAVIFAMSDLKLIGNDGASLQVSGNYQDAIASKDDLTITNLSLEIEASDDGLRGKDSVAIADSKLTINAGGDGIKSDNDDGEKGNVSLTDSSITINAENDGIHAENVLEIFSGSIDILDAFEGIEGKVITIHDGDIRVVSRDDGINVSGTIKLKGENVLADGELNIKGGTITINSSGDGFDSNGNATMTGGTLIINGPTEDNNGSIDVNGTFLVSGGTIIAIGSAGMSETPSDTSSQYSLQVNFASTQSAGAVVSVKSSDGVEALSYLSVKQFQSIVYSSEKLVPGETYTVSLDGQEYATLSLDSVITVYGEIVQNGRRGGL